MQYSMQLTEEIPNDPPQMGAKSTTTSNHPSTPGRGEQPRHRNKEAQHIPLIYVGNSKDAYIMAYSIAFLL